MGKAALKIPLEARIYKFLFDHKLLVNGTQVCRGVNGRKINDIKFCRPSGPIIDVAANNWE